MSSRTALWQLTAMSTRDLMRDKLTGFAPLFLFGWLLLIYWLFTIMLPNAADSASTHPLRLALPSIVMTGITATAFMATTVPLVAMRERDLLRLLGTTPLKRSTFVLAQLPIRVVLVGVQVAVGYGVAITAGFTGETSNLLRLLTTTLIGSAMLFACALLVAGRGQSAESSHHISVAVALGAMMCSGTFLPIAAGTLSPLVESLPRLLPTTWFASALAPDLTGGEAFMPVPLLWAMMLVMTVVAGVTALRRFEWSTGGSPAHVPTHDHRAKEAVTP
ncbi:ABC transporter permease [Leucobacter sp. UCMA 4100]|uniref:ABC transporter permease n=1 Tax=Leucobacter sp. UCMA 4100 TaxID=2810534 RepID=UPI0022EA5A2F|nr:ABC transporter permease [Leucobacter sp. UCMA 4100]MDA3146481.1 ABC transporter permease [Leucobacter sp. UCMA 4100]